MFYVTKESSYVAVSRPPASPVFTTPVGSMRTACTSPRAIGQCFNSLGDDKQLAGADFHPNPAAPVEHRVRRSREHHCFRAVEDLARMGTSL